MLERAKIGINNKIDPEFYRDNMKRSIVNIFITDEVMKDKSFTYTDSIINAAYTYVDNTATNTFMLTLHGYDSDPREVYQIPQYVRFVKKMIEHDERILCLLNADSLFIIALCYGFKVAANKGAVTSVGVDKTKVMEYNRILNKAIDNEKVEQINFKANIESMAYIKKIMAGFSR